ncbi:phosphate transport system permease protein [Glaciihabitans tibetensis]|uniref:Phosphate transport system permease protein PstA n=1 Tax=Glaciihabitans tibetensis TaxID=1266600 RepID=A0A2T0VCN2_9MICO|nr:phosphate ABC transporter permease PstA [Glaciihabitans tibetensis]PRY67938.1 phosphate transport system permease protein [Glaciihabitans tibetensis]
MTIEDTRTSEAGAATGSRHAGAAAPGRRTVLPALSSGARHPTRPEVRRNLASIGRDDVLRVLGAAAAGIATTSWLFTQIVAFDGALPFVLISYVLFLGYFVVLISFDDNRVTIIDRVANVIIHSLAVVLILALIVVVVFTVIRGSEALFHFNFWTQDLSTAGPLDPLTTGGMLHAAIGTLIMIAFALTFSIPLGLLCAVFLSEFPGKFSRLVRTVVEAMTALPSIICGLFIYATYVLMFGLDRSGFAASLAITIMILPIIIRSADVVLRLVPGTLKEASLGLGAGQWRTIWNVVLPTSRSGLMTAIILGTARGIGETSPVLLTAGYTTYINMNPFTGPMVSLPFATFTLVKSPEPSQIARGFGAAAVLMVLVFLLFLIARLIGGRGPGQLSRRARRRVAAASIRDAQRYTQRSAVGNPSAGGTASHGGGHSPESLQQTGSGHK